MKRARDAANRALPRFVAVYAPRVPLLSSAFLLCAYAVLAPMFGRAYHAFHTEGMIVSEVSSATYEMGTKFKGAWDRETRALETSLTIIPSV